MRQLLKYGLYEDILVHISEVRNGLSCNCFCPSCQHPLVAKNNHTNKKAEHFAHYSGKECEGAIESALHLLAKTILLKSKKIKIPKYHFDYNPYNEKSVYRASSELVFDNIILEKSIDIDGEKIIADAIGEKNERKVIIEFAKTHFVDEVKKAKLKKQEIACIEIDLKDLELDESALTNFLSSDSPSKYWIVNRRLDNEYIEEQRKLRRIQQIVDEQRAEEIENKSIENAIKIYSYKNQNQYKVFKTDDFGKVRLCPLNKLVLKTYKTSRLYKNPTLKKIIDEGLWNGEIYGRFPNKKFIFIEKEEIVVFPPIYYKGNDEIDNETNKLLYAGLKEIKKALNNPILGNCVNCEFYVDEFYIGDRDYKVCKYRNDNNRPDFTNKGSS